MDKLEKIECQELGMDPNKTYIVNLYFDESIDRKWKDKYNSLTGFRSNTSIGTKSATTGNKETKNG
jgi:hypothetical protein